MPTIKSIEQARAKFAWECAKVRNKDYGRQVNKAPAYIKTNGLLNTMAFFYSKPGEGKGEALTDFRKWLSHSDCGLLPASEDTNDKMLDFLLLKQESDARFLIHCTAEVLALLNWLRRFAKSE
jgi:CRISPR type III-B/RAMP module-associated protein Cmr5